LLKKSIVHSIFYIWCVAEFEAECTSYLEGFPGYLLSHRFLQCEPEQNDCSRQKSVLELRETFQQALK